MKPWEVQKAAELLAQLKKADETIGNLTPMNVVGIIVDREDGAGIAGRDGLTLRKGIGGTGWAGSIGYPDSLRDAMTAALVEWAKKQRADAISEAKRLGVEIEE